MAGWCWMFLPWRIRQVYRHVFERHILPWISIELENRSDSWRFSKVSKRKKTPFAPEIPRMHAGVFVLIVGGKLGIINLIIFFSFVLTNRAVVKLCLKVVDAWNNAIICLGWVAGVQIACIFHPPIWANELLRRAVSSRHVTLVNNWRASRIISKLRGAFKNKTAFRTRRYVVRRRAGVFYCWATLEICWLVTKVFQFTNRWSGDRGFV